MPHFALNRDFALTWVTEVHALLALATWLSPTQYENFAAAAFIMHHLKLSSKVMSEFSKVMENKVSEVNSGNVPDRLRPIAQGLGQGYTQY